MTATGHAIIGTVIAAKISNPALAIPLALASHIAADLFPHWDFATNEEEKGIERVRQEAVIDVISGFVISYLLILWFFPQTNILYAFIIILAAQFFDWATAPYYFFNMKGVPFVWFYNIQKMFDNRLKEPWGIINQVVILILLIIVAKLF